MTDFKGYTEDEVKNFTLHSFEHIKSPHGNWVKVHAIKPNGDLSLGYSIPESDFLMDFFKPLTKPSVQVDKA